MFKLKENTLYFKALCLCHTLGASLLLSLNITLYASAQDPTEQGLPFESPHAAHVSNMIPSKSLYPGGPAAQGVLYAHERLMVHKSEPLKEPLYVHHFALQKSASLCQRDFTVPNLMTFLESAHNDTDALFQHISHLKNQAQTPDTGALYHAAIITAHLKTQMMPSAVMIEHALPGEYVMDLPKDRRPHATAFLTLRQNFTQEFLRHKYACLALYGTLSTQLRTLTGVHYKSSATDTFDLFQRDITRLWDAFFTVERCARDACMDGPSTNLRQNTLTDIRLLHWTSQCPSLAQKIITTWDALFVTHTHHLISNKDHPDLEELPPFLAHNGICLARIMTQPTLQIKGTPIHFSQAPCPTISAPQSDPWEDDNTVSIKTGESSTDETTDLDENVSFMENVLASPTPGTFNIFMASSLPQRLTGADLFKELFGLDNEWDLSDLCSPQERGEEDDMGLKDGYNDLNG